MKKIITLSLILTLSLNLVSCGSTAEESSKLNDWQIEILQAEGLPTEYDELTISQQHSIKRIYEMINYLNEKYKEEFIYVQYIQKELNESEKLIAYPRSVGAEEGKYLVTVKVGNDGVFTDDYFDYSVADYSESLINDFIGSYFDEEDYRYFSSPNACDIKKTEIIDGNFQWKYGAANNIFIKEVVCDMDEVEKFAVEYAKFLYEHQISGTHRIEIMHKFPNQEEDWKDIGEICGNWDGDVAGFYHFSFGFSNGFGFPHNTAKSVHTGSVNYDADNIRISEEYKIEEYFSKYK